MYLRKLKAFQWTRVIIHFIWVVLVHLERPEMTWVRFPAGAIELGLRAFHDNWVHHNDLHFMQENKFCNLEKLHDMDVLSLGDSLDMF